MNQHIKKLLNAGEGETLDYKQSISSSKKIAKTMSAFANSKGGVLLVGVRDNRTISGIKSEEEKYMLEMAAYYFCKPEVKIEQKIWEVDNKEILECTILESKEKPVLAQTEDDQWMAYVRVKDKSLLASKIVVDVMRKNTKNHSSIIRYSNIEKALLQYLTENERITLMEYKLMVNISKRRASKIIVNLIMAGVIRSHTTEKVEYYTLA